MKHAVRNKPADQSVTDLALTPGHFDESHFKGMKPGFLIQFQAIAGKESELDSGVVIASYFFKKSGG